MAFDPERIRIRSAVAKLRFIAEGLIQIKEFNPDIEESLNGGIDILAEVTDDLSNICDNIPTDNQNMGNTSYNLTLIDWDSVHDLEPEIQDHEDTEECDTDEPAELSRDKVAIDDEGLDAILKEATDVFGSDTPVAAFPEFTGTIVTNTTDDIDILSDKERIIVMVLSENDWMGFNDLESKTYISRPTLSKYLNMLLERHIVVKRVPEVEKKKSNRIMWALHLEYKNDPDQFNYLIRKK